MRHTSVLFLSLYFLLLASQPVFGGGITNFNWDPQIESYILDVNFGAVKGNANDPQNNHIINVGGLWTVNITIVENPPTFLFGQASVTITGSTQHVVAPHNGDDPKGNAQPIDFSFIAPATIPPNGLFTPSSGPMFQSHPHIDHFDEFSLDVIAHVSGTLTTRDIDDWELIMRGVHVAPEPSTLILVGTILALLGATAWRRQHRHG